VYISALSGEERAKLFRSLNQHTPGAWRLSSDNMSFIIFNNLEQHQIWWINFTTINN
jgi:hypothetical protein